MSYSPGGTWYFKSWHGTVLFLVFLYHSVVMCFCRVLFAPRFQHDIFLKVNLFQLKFRKC